jgi:hypothetical protein
MARYRKEASVDGGWSRWVQPIRRSYKFCCCDCGLVHNMDFRVRKGRAQFRASRNNRSTAQVRRHMKKET